MPVTISVKCFYVTFRNYLAYSLDSGFTKSLMITSSKKFCFLNAILQFMFFQLPKLAHQQFPVSQLVLSHSSCHALRHIKHKWRFCHKQTWCLFQMCSWVLVIKILSGYQPIWNVRQHELILGRAFLAKAVRNTVQTRKWTTKP